MRVGESITFETYNDTVFPNLDMVSYRGCFDNAVGANMNVVADFHGIKIEIPSIGFIRRSGEKEHGDET